MHRKIKAELHVTWYDNGDTEHNMIDMDSAMRDDVLKIIEESARQEKARYIPFINNFTGRVVLLTSIVRDKVISNNIQHLDYVTVSQLVNDGIKEVDRKCHFLDGTFRKEITEHFDSNAEFNKMIDDFLFDVHYCRWFPHENGRLATTLRALAEGETDKKEETKQQVKEFIQDPQVIISI